MLWQWPGFTVFIIGTVEFPFSFSYIYTRNLRVFVYSKFHRLFFSGTVWLLLDFRKLLKVCYQGVYKLSNDLTFIAF